MAALPASRLSLESTVGGESRGEDPQALAELLTSWHWAEWSPALIERRSNVAAEIVELGRRIESPETVLDGLFFQANDALECGAVDLFRAAIEEHAGLAGVTANPSHLRRTHQLRAMQLGVEGDFAAADRTATAALDLGEVASLRALESVIAQMSHRMERLVQEERFDEMEGQLIPLPGEGPNRSTVVASWAEYYRFVGQLDDARRVFGTLAARDFEEVPQKAEDLHMLADVCVALNDHRAATILAERLRPWRERMLIAPSCSICFGSGDRFLGNLAIARGEFGDAADHFERALWLCQRLEAWPFVIDVQTDYGRLRRLRGAQGDASVARRLFQEALDSAEHRGLAQRASTAREQIAAL